ncbi:hypothetical protein [Lysinibacillus xylanilyticus]|uniref:hypothetical protein n=1 Tax=Lysinibacillus xylanilyticus TaxID=582475 RepID=UPI003CFED55D
MPPNTIGEIAVKSNQNMIGFYNEAELTKATIIDGWIHTRDMGYLNEEGYEKLDLKTFYSLPTPKSYVYFYQDNALPRGENYGWHPNMSSRLGQFRLNVGDGDHFTDTRTRPAMVAQKFYEAGRD